MSDGFRPAAGIATLPSVRVTVDGTVVEAPAIWSVADLLLSRGSHPYRRTAVSGVPRGPFCMMGTCFDCLVTVNGEVDRQGCLVRLREGMAIRRQEDDR
jgi:predicted molibdopterin-dependent oxidoreductase YjgC